MYSLQHFLPPHRHRKFQFLFIFLKSITGDFISSLKPNVHQNTDFLQSKRKPPVAVKFITEHSSTPQKMTLPFQSFTWAYTALKYFCLNHPLPLLLHHIRQTLPMVQGSAAGENPHNVEYFLLSSFTGI